MDYIEDFKRQIQDYRELDEEYAYETNVTAIANAILEFSDKTRKNGYIIKDECVMRALRKDVVAVYQSIRADKVVSKIRDKPIRNSVLPRELPILVIGCKHYSDNRPFDDDDVKQLQDYMLAIEFRL